ncbi:MAG: hypothetical protein GY817_01190 [bacterium]|nr:hypothetical protein [bacterium]
MSEIINQTYNGVLPQQKTEIFSFTNDTGKPLVLRGLGGESTGSGEWFVYIDDILKVKRRNTAALINIDVDFHRHELPVSKSIKVKVIHYEDDSQDYSIDLRYTNG